MNAGMLILTDNEGRKIEFPLKEGRNRIGRKSESNSPDIAVEGDAFVSRNHAVLVVRLNQKSDYEYVIADNAEVQGKPSLNGTFINSSPERLGSEPVILFEGDTITVGRNTFELKTAIHIVETEQSAKLKIKAEEEEVVTSSVSGAVLRKKI